MKKLILLLPVILLLVLSLRAQPYLITATNYAAGFFGVVADENGQPLAVGSIVHLIWDATGDGLDDPSVLPGSMGLPTGDDLLMGSAQIGVTGGAPSAGTFVIPGTTTTSNGWCYVRAFHAATPTLGSYYSESISAYDIPVVAIPIIYGIQFPTAMTRTLGNVPSVSLTLTPQNPPINIPPTGGSFQCTIQLHNNTTQAVQYDVWIDLVTPSGSIYGPIFTRPGLSMPGQVTWSRVMTQAIPPNAPPGVYLYRAHAGNQPSGSIIHEDSFPFEKQGAGSSDGLSPNFTGWETTGWEGGVLTTTPIPDVFFLAAPYPNPFNPTAQIRFGLPKNADVRIDVYNLLGSRVTTLMDRSLQAGYHNVIWDATNVASGLYFVQMKAGGFVYTEKALLLK